VKYWKITIENLRNDGWNCGCMATTDGKGRPIWIVAAQRNDAGRFIVHDYPANRGPKPNAELGDYR